MELSLRSRLDEKRPSGIGKTYSKWCSEGGEKQKRGTNNLRHGGRAEGVKGITLAHRLEGTQMPRKKIVGGEGRGGPGSIKYGGQKKEKIPKAKEGASEKTSAAREKTKRARVGQGGESSLY